MTYDTLAQKKYGAKPIWLYEITFDGVTERYCSGLKSYDTPSGAPTADYATTTTWAAGPVWRKSFKRDKDAKASLELAIPKDSAIAQSLSTARYQGQCTVRVYHGYRTDPDDEFIQEFTGYVQKLRPGFVAVTLSCVDNSILFGQGVVGRTIQIPCPYVLGSPACGVDRSTFEDTLSCTSKTDLDLTITGADANGDNYYTNGTLTYNGSVRRITSQIGTTVTISYDIDDLTTFPSDVVLLRPCSKSVASCVTFSNHLNFGGFEKMEDSPYDGGSIV